MGRIRQKMEYKKLTAEEIKYYSVPSEYIKDDDYYDSYHPCWQQDGTIVVTDNFAQKLTIHFTSNGIPDWSNPEINS